MSASVVGLSLVAMLFCFRYISDIYELFLMIDQFKFLRFAAVCNIVGLVYLLCYIVRGLMFPRLQPMELSQVYATASFPIINSFIRITQWAQAGNLLNLPFLRAVLFAVVIGHLILASHILSYRVNSAISEAEIAEGILSPDHQRRRHRYIILLRFDLLRPVAGIPVAIYLLLRFGRVELPNNGGLDMFYRAGCIALLHIAVFYAQSVVHIVLHLLAPILFRTNQSLQQLVTAVFDLGFSAVEFGIIVGTCANTALYAFTNFTLYDTWRMLRSKWATLHTRLGRTMLVQGAHRLRTGLGAHLRRLAGRLPAPAPVPAPGRGDADQLLPPGGGANAPEAFRHVFRDDNGNNIIININQQHIRPWAFKPRYLYILFSELYDFFDVSRSFAQNWQKLSRASKSHRSLGGLTKPSFMDVYGRPEEEVRAEYALRQKERDAAPRTPKNNGLDGGGDQLVPSTEVCAVCLDGFDLIRLPNDARRLACGHIYHLTCLRNWAVNGNTMCPMCNADIFAKKEEHQASDATSGSRPSSSPDDAEAAKSEKNSSDNVSDVLSQTKSAHSEAPLPGNGTAEAAVPQSPLDAAACDAVSNNHVLLTTHGATEYSLNNVALFLPIFFTDPALSWENATLTDIEKALRESARMYIERMHTFRELRRTMNGLVTDIEQCSYKLSSDDPSGDE